MSNKDIELDSITESEKIKELILTILAGQHYFDSNLVSELESNLEQSFQFYKSCIDYYNHFIDKIKKSLDYELKILEIEGIKVPLRSYEKSNININIELLGESISPTGENSNKDKSYLEAFYKICLINIELADIELGYYCCEKTEIKLVDYKKIIVGIKGVLIGGIDDKYINLTLGKVNFLLYKLLKRYQVEKIISYIEPQNKGNVSSLLQNITVDSLEKELSLVGYENWIKIIQKHYLDTDCSVNKIATSLNIDFSEGINNYDRFKNLYTENTTIYEFIIVLDKLIDKSNLPRIDFKLIHEYNKKLKNYLFYNFLDNDIKQIEKSLLIRLENKLREKLELISQHLKDKETINYYPILSLKNFLINRLFDVVFIINLTELNTSEVNSVSKLIEKLNKFKNIAEEIEKQYYSNNDNTSEQSIAFNMLFFKYYNTKIITLLYHLEKLVKESIVDLFDTKKYDSIIRFDYYHHILQFTNDLTNVFYENLKKSIDHINVATTKKHYPYYLNKENCEIKIEGISIFVNASYILPAYYGKVEEHMKARELKFKSISSRLINLCQIEMATCKISKFEERVQKTEFTAVQLIGFFIGVVTFIVGSISVVPKFQYGDSFEVVVAFFICFAACILLFVLGLSALLNPLRTENTDLIRYFKRELKFSAILFFCILILIIGVLNIYSITSKGTIKAVDSPNVLDKKSR